MIPNYTHQIMAFSTMMEMVKLHPNDQELGEAIRTYIGQYMRGELFIKVEPKKDVYGTERY